MSICSLDSHTPPSAFFLRVDLVSFIFASHAYLSSVTSLSRSRVPVFACAPSSYRLTSPVLVAFARFSRLVRMILLMSSPIL